MTGNHVLTLATYLSHYGGASSSSLLLGLLGLQGQLNVVSLKERYCGKWTRQGMDWNCALTLFILLQLHLAQDSGGKDHLVN